MPTEIVDDAPAASGLPPGSRFGRYEVVRKLGEGGMGAVYEARLKAAGGHHNGL